MNKISALIPLKYMAILLPPLLVTGSFLPDLVVSISSLFFIFYIIQNKIYFLFNNIIFKYLILFYFIINFSSLLSDNILFSLRSSFPYFRFIIYSLLIYYLCIKFQNFQKFFYYSLLSTFLVLIFDGYLQYFNGENLQGYLISPSSRLGGLFGDEKILGSYLARLFPLLLYFFFNIKKKTKLMNFFFFLIAILIEVLVFLTGERGSFFLITLSLIYLLVLIDKHRGIKFFLILISFILIFIQVLTNEGLKNRMIKITYNDLSSSSFFSKIHEKFYFTAFEIYKNNKIFGSGPNTFRIECKKINIENQTCSTHPHNTYIQLLSETGILGFSTIFIIFLYLVFISLKQFYYLMIKKNYLSDGEVALVLCFFITLWPVIPSGNFFNNYMSIIYFLPLGFYLSTFKIVNDSN